MATATKSNYDAGLPLDEWVAAQESTDSPLYRDMCGNAVDLIEYMLHRLFIADHEGRKDFPVRVIGEHDYKGHKVPIFSIISPGVVEVRLCHKIPVVSFDWVVSVKSKQPIDIDFRDLFDQEERADFQDFGDGWDLPQFEVDGQEFSLMLDSEHELYTFCWLLTRELRINH